MQCVILAGGLGTRLGNIVEQIPKPMLPINGKPFLEYQVELLVKNGIKSILLCVGHLHEQITDYFGDGYKWGIEIFYSIETEKLLGTAGAIRNAYALLEDDFFLMYGDSYLPVHFPEIYDAYTKSPHNILMTVYRNNAQWDTSNIIYNNMQIIKYDKNNIIPEMNYIDYGLFVISKSLVKSIPTDVHVNLDRIQYEFVEKKMMASFEVKNRFYEIGSVNGLNEFIEYTIDNKL